QGAGPFADADDVLDVQLAPRHLDLQAGRPAGQRSAARLEVAVDVLFQAQQVVADGRLQQRVEDAAADVQRRQVDGTPAGGVVAEVHEQVVFAGGVAVV